MAGSLASLLFDGPQIYEKWLKEEACVHAGHVHSTGVCGMLRSE